MERLQLLVEKWFGSCDKFNKLDPQHALRCAAHFLHEAKVLTDAEHERIILSNFG